MNALSSTSSRTSRISSTSERGAPVVRPGLGRRFYGLLRLAHPFPSALDAAITAVVAGYAGGAPDVVARLALSMFALQAAIGATNDIVDAPSDLIAKPGKPIPGGLVPRRLASSVAAAAGVIGLVLGATVSPAALTLAACGTAAGLAYDLRLKGTAASWLPFAVGIPLLPLFAWIGAAGEAPTAILVLAGLAVPSGAAIALANAVPDLERDLGSGVRTAVTALGRARSVQVLAVLQAVVVAGALGSFAILVGAAGAPASGPGGRVDPAGPAVGLVAACVALAIGVALSSRPSVAARQRGWELQAIATGGVAAAWLGGLAAAGRF